MRLEIIVCRILNRKLLDLRRDCCVS